MAWLKFRLMVRRVCFIYLTRWAIMIERKFLNGSCDGLCCDKYESKEQ